jgi:MFS family permease
MVITGTMLAMPIMVPFYHSIGMDQGQIGLSQAIFTVALLLINLPTGWLADRFSRRLSNVAGDFVATLGVLYYSQASSFTEVVIAEVLLGVSLAFSQGADGALLRAYTQLLDPSGRMFHKQYARLAIWQPLAQIVALVIGGAIGASNPRLAIALAAIPYAVGCLLSLCLREEGARLVAKHRNPLRDMVRVVHESVGPDPYLRWLIVAYSVGREITHVMIWALTPLLLVAGVPAQIVAIGWVLNSLSVVVGAHIANRWGLTMRAWQKFASPVALVLFGLLVMSSYLSLTTIWLYACLGLAQGWTAAVLQPLIQAQTDDCSQATIISIAKSASQLLYIPLVWVVGVAGNIDIRLTMVATAVIFAPLALITTRRLYALERI